jgi:hypothetical protein
VTAAPSSTAGSPATATAPAPAASGATTTAPTPTGDATATPATAGERWHRLPRRWRAVLIALAALLALYFASSLVAGVYQSPNGTPTGPSSSVDPSPEGTEALAQLLADRHHPVQSLTTPLASASLPTAGTLFVLDPVNSLTQSLPALRRYLAGGGHLVLGGRVGPGALRPLLGTTDTPTWQATSAGVAQPVEHTRQDTGVANVLSGPGGSYTVPAGSNFSTLLAGVGGALALDATVGSGTLVLLANTTPLQNGALAQADDAAFALDLAGPATAPVAFDEYDHGLGRSGTGLAGLPTHWKVALALAVLAALVWIWSAARRFGPPQLAERELIPARVAHVDAMAALLASGNADRLAAASAPLRDEGRSRLRRLLRANPSATDAELAELAASADLPSLTPELVSSLLDPPRSESGVVDEGRAFVALSRGTPDR